MNKYLHKVKSIVVFVLIFICINLAFYYFVFKPEKRNDIEGFKVCIIDRDSVKSIYLDEISKNTIFCKENIKMHKTDNIMYSAETKVVNISNKGIELEIHEIADNMGDPHTYRYILHNDKKNTKIEPLWQLGGGNFAKFFTGVCSLFLCMIYMAWSIDRKKHKPKT